MMDFGKIFSGAAGLFGGGGKNPADQANKYISQIPGQTNPYNQPYFEAGKSQLPELQNQYHEGMTNPGGRYNQIGESFHESPGFKFAMQQALQGANNGAASGGMFGSPQNTQQNMTLATDLANQDYYKYMKGATDLYGNAMTGGQNMANQGQQAGKSQADTIAQALAQQGAYGYEGQAQRNQNKNSAWSDLASGIFSF
jgi:hypothetical protein